MFVDRLSALPDSILCYILSFLQTKEAAKTCLLSKRWQYVWNYLPWLLFEDDSNWEMKDVRKFVIRVNRTLIICSRHKLDGFKVNFNCKYEPRFASDVNVWITFAVKNEVKDFFLLLPGRRKCYHMLPQLMYSNLSLTSLTLEGCIMAPRGTIQWPSVTTLRLMDIELNEHTLEKILSGCLVLSSLDLCYCKGFNRIEVNSPSLHMLKIVHGAAAVDLKISAPYLHTLKIFSTSKSRKLCLENIKSLVRAEIDIYGLLLNDTESVKKSAEQLFGSIRHVKMLWLGPNCNQFLSLITSKWKLPQSTRRCLELYAIHGNTSIPGIVALLKSSPNLETLVIHVYKSSWTHVTSDPASKDDLDCDLFHLKTVCFKKSRNLYDDIDEPVLTLARSLLKRAIVLEKMVIDFPRPSAPSSVTAFDKITRELLIHSRSSQKAVVLFN